MIIDGRAIAKDVEGSLRQKISQLNLERKPKVSFVTFGEEPTTRSFLQIKQKVAERLGVNLSIHELPEDVLENIAIQIFTSIIEGPDNDGVVVQLPLPKQIDRESFLSLIPKEKDIDCLSSFSTETSQNKESLFSPPVALAVAEILKRHNIDVRERSSAVVGQGNLVGKPVVSWLQSMGAKFEIFDFGSDLMRLKEFDVIVSGTGSPEIIKKEMIKDGAVLIDAGTSELEGKLVGDISKDAFEKASLVTPVPGGIGPVTVVKLFENLLRAIEVKS